MSTLQSQITDGIKDAMRSKDKVRLATLRDVKSKFMLEQSKAGASVEIKDEEAIKIISKLHRQRIDTSEVYKEQSREDLASDEVAQAEILSEFLPKAMSDNEIETKVIEIIAKTGASGMGDMGRVMGMASAAMAGQADGKVISGFVRTQLLK
ncbi:MAG TPA: GatB/YqeY domain-containing protein [Flavobacteriales bacterium]|nr:GatB/YqeY domain-containing protein [Flavobacteriales bacterium]